MTDPAKLSPSPVNDPLEGRDDRARLSLTLLDHTPNLGRGAPVHVPPRLDPERPAGDHEPASAELAGHALVRAVRASRRDDLRDLGVRESERTEDVRARRVDVHRPRRLDGHLAHEAGPIAGAAED